MEAKTCTICEKELPLDAFAFRTDRGRRTRYAMCKACRGARTLAYYEAHKAQHKTNVSRRYHEFGRFKRYGLTAEQYADRLASQNGCCALCKAHKPGGKGVWHIDHRHEAKPARGQRRPGFNQCEAKDVRGLLCHPCNIALGHYEKLTAKVGRAAVVAYLGLISDGEIDDPLARR